MISTQMSAEEAKEYSGTPEPGDMPKYSYGTMLCLDDELIERLGIKAPPTVGTEFTLTARCVVVGTSQRQQQSGDSESSLDLQITEMDLKAPTKGDADVFYGD